MKNTNNSITIISNNKKIKSVTFLKGIAILMVILVHSAQTFELPKWCTTITCFGQMGCQIFIVLSSFSLCLSFERKKTTYINFIINRIKRLVPGYWTMIVIYIIFRLINITDIYEDTLNPINIFLNIFLLNGLIPTSANNLVVRGGWFVGTIFILYLLFPLMFKVFNVRKKWWKKKKIYLFPLIICTVSNVIIIVLSKINPMLICENNSFIYFSFLNQIPSFALGFSLYYLYKKNFITKIKFTFLKTMFFIILAFILFHSNLELAFIFIPTIFSIGFVYLFMFFYNLDKKVNLYKLKFINKICNFGENSFGIYLIHSFVTYEFAGMIKIILSYINVLLPDVTLYFILLPIIYILSFFIGKLFNKYLRIISNYIFNERFI